MAEKEKYLEEVRKQGNAEEIRKAEEALKEAKDKLALAEKDYEKYQSNPKTQPDFEGEDSAKKAWESEKRFWRKAYRMPNMGGRML